MHSTKKFILGIGNPIIDISATSDAEHLHKFELDFGNTVFANEKNYGIFEALEKSPDVTYVPGGSVTNSIRVLNWCLKNNSHFGCILLGCVGNDNYGKRIKSELDAVNVKSLLEVTDKYASSRCGVAIHLKERCLIPEILASTHLSDDFVEKMKNDNFGDVEIALLEGYFVKENPEMLRKLIAYFHQRNKKIALTLSATFMIQFFYEVLKEMADESDIIFCNEEEALLFSKIDSKDYEAISLAIHKTLKPRESRLLVITCGKHPVVISKYDIKNDQLEYVVKYSVPPVKEEEIVDTNGCGDSFVGGFLSQYIQGHDLVTCAKWGVAAASTILKNIGATFPEKCEL